MAHKKDMLENPFQALFLARRRSSKSAHAEARIQIDLQVEAHRAGLERLQIEHRHLLLAFDDQVLLERVQARDFLEAGIEDSYDFRLFQTENPNAAIISSDEQQIKVFSDINQVHEVVNGPPQKGQIIVVEVFSDDLIAVVEGDVDPHGPVAFLGNIKRRLVLRVDPLRQRAEPRKVQIW